MNAPARAGRTTAARAVRVTRHGVRVRMPVLGSVVHGTAAAVGKGCLCVACDQLRTSTAAAAARPAPPKVRPTQPAPGRRSDVDEAAVDRACVGQLPAGRLTAAERTAAVSRLTRSGLSARQVSVRIGLTPRSVVRARRRAGRDNPAPPPARAAGETSWRDEALCRQVDPELFYPETGGSTREAKQVCAGCPVQAECLAWAVEHGERHGVWGGLSPAEREQLRNRMVVRAG